MRTAVFPGSFNPITIGHIALLRQALKLFDKVIVAVGVNIDKRGASPVEERINRIRQATAGMERVEIMEYDILTTDFCRQVGANFIVRGLRGTADFENESEIAEVNRLLAPEIETVFLLSEPQYKAISSSMVRQLKAFGKDTSKYES